MVDSVLRLYKDVVDGVKSLPLLPPSRYFYCYLFFLPLWLTYSSAAPLTLHTPLRLARRPNRAASFEVHACRKNILRSVFGATISYTGTFWVLSFGEVHGYFGGFIVSWVGMRGHTNPSLGEPRLSRSLDSKALSRPLVFLKK